MNRFALLFVVAPSVAAVSAAQNVSLQALAVTPIGLHAAWNFFEGSVYGFPVSGSTRDSLLTVEARGPELATGGAFGPEGSLVGLAAMLLTALVLWLIRARVPTTPARRPAAAA